MELTRDLLDAVCDIAVEAGQLTLPIYYSDFDVETKDDDSPLTQADLAAHRHIQAALTRLTPDTPQLSEEGAETPYAERRGWAEHWLVDPLDGTREFVNKNDQFTINIALIRDHVPVLGVVYAPVLDTPSSAPARSAPSARPATTRRGASPCRRGPTRRACWSRARTAAAKWTPCWRACPTTSP